MFKFFVTSINVILGPPRKIPKLFCTKILWLFFIIFKYSKCYLCTKITVLCVIQSKILRIIQVNKANKKYCHNIIYVFVLKWNNCVFQNCCTTIKKIELRFIFIVKGAPSRTHLFSCFISEAFIHALFNVRLFTADEGFSCTILRFLKLISLKYVRGTEVENISFAPCLKYVYYNFSQIELLLNSIE